MRLSRLAPHGAWLPLVVLLAGAAVPAAGELATDAIGLSTFAITLCGVLALGAGRPSGAEGRSALAMACAVSLLAPVLAYGAALALGVPPDLRALMVVAAAAPIGQSIGALAAALGLPDRAATMAALATALAAPVVLPLASHLLTPGELAISAEALAERAAWLVTAPALLAFLLRRAFPARVAALRADFRGVVVLALSVYAAARAPGLLMSLEEPLVALYLTGLACVVTAGAMLAGWALAVPFGREVGLAGTFAAGARNVPVAWAAVAPGLDAQGMLFMALTVIPFYALPVLMRQVVRWSRPSALGGTAAAWARAPGASWAGAARRGLGGAGFRRPDDGAGGAPSEEARPGMVE